MRYRLPPLLFLLIALAPGAAAAQTMPLARYREAVAASRSALERGLTRERAERLAGQLKAVRTVTYPDGQRVAVDNRQLAALLDKASVGSAADRKKTRAEIVARLRALDRALSPTALPAQTAVDPREQARRLLATEEFRRGFQETPPKSWWERQWERILKAISDFFGRLRGPQMGSGGAALGQFLIFLLYFVAVVAGVIALYALGTALRERRRRLRRTGGMGLSDLDDDLPDPLGAAREHAAAGDFRGALRLAYIASLRRLSGAGLLTLEPDKTNWEYQRALRGRSGDAYQTLLPVTRDFDRVWYGRNPATREEYERAVAAHGALPEAMTEETGGTRGNAW